MYTIWILTMFQNKEIFREGRRFVRESRVTRHASRFFRVTRHASRSYITPGLLIFTLIVPGICFSAMSAR